MHERNEYENRETKEKAFMTHPKHAVLPSVYVLITHGKEFEKYIHSSNDCDQTIKDKLVKLSYP